MRTNDPMTTNATQATTNGWTLVQWSAIYEAACDSTEAEHMAGIDPDDTDAQEQGRKAVADAVTNTWNDGRSLDEWVSAALRSLRAA
jgi:hypothetical protein